MKTALQILILVYSLQYLVAEDTTVTPETPGTADKNGTIPLPEDTSVCKKSNTVPSDETVELPVLHSVFETRIEATFIQKQKTIDFVEYYDNINNRGAVYQTKDGDESIYLYDFDNQESYLIKNEICETSDMNGTAFQFFSFSNGQKEKGHIAGVSDLFNFGTQYNETFLDSTTSVRGIPVNRWKACIHWDRFNTDFEMIFSFSKPDYQLPNGEKKAIPLRIEVKGKAEASWSVSTPHEYNHIYDFVSYRPGIKDETVFDIPAGVHCKRSGAGKTRPQFADQFGMAFEVIRSSEKHVDFHQVYYNLKSNLSRVDLRPNKDSTFSTKFGNQRLKVIHDYNSGLQFVIDMRRENCTVSQIPNDTMLLDVKLDPHAENMVIMKHGEEIFDFNQMDFTYQGERNVRGVPSDVWTASIQDFPEKGVLSTIEAHFSADGWTMEPLGMSQSVPLKIYQNPHSNTLEKTYDKLQFNIFNYDVGPQGLSAFDVKMCVDRKDMKHLVFKLSGTYDKLVKRRVHLIQPAVQAAIAAYADVEPIRVTDLFFDVTDDESVDVWFTLLEKMEVDGNVANPVESIPLKDAYKNIKRAISEEPGLIVEVKYSISETKRIPVEKDSLKTDKDLMDPRSDNAICPVGGKYSGGSMFGLGFAMLVLGVVMGVVIGYCLWKRGLHSPRHHRHIPYEFQD